MKKNRYVNDTVYGHIPYSGIEEKVLQSRIFNRLLFISQNALAYFAFPSVSTKRYIHSMGTMHMVSHLFRHALLNADKALRSEFFAAMRRGVDALIAAKGIALKLDTLRIEDKTLHAFALPLNTQEQTLYLILLQSLRLAGLLHDVGHLPFSHQSEYAMERIYRDIAAKSEHTKEQRRFMAFYETYTKSGSEALHERLGFAYLALLFENEVLQSAHASRELVRLYAALTEAILDERSFGEIDFAVLHEFVSSTIDADRLDYINRDQLASAYVAAGSDLMRLAKEAVLIRHRGAFRLSYFTSALYDVEHVLEMRFNLYKKVFATHNIRLLDTLLEEVIAFLAQRYLARPPKKRKLYETIAMMWKVLYRKNPQKRLDLLSQLDENWLITLFKSEYFKIKYKKHRTDTERFYLTAFEEILFGKRAFYSYWANLSQFYAVLGFEKKERLRFKERFGTMSRQARERLEARLRDIIARYENEGFFAYSIVSLSVGIEDRFVMFDGEKAVTLDEISTVRKRLATSLANTVPFFMYGTQKHLSDTMKRELKAVARECFDENEE